MAKEDEELNNFRGKLDGLVGSPPKNVLVFTVIVDMTGYEETNQVSYSMLSNIDKGALVEILQNVIKRIEDSNEDSIVLN